MQISGLPKRNFAAFVRIGFRSTFLSLIARMQQRPAN
jgi:hypothetical protein